ncbi:MAG: ABC transporter substrate-binding protein [Chloroflexi bacterium]|nr:ABC transporter substrate-binding protein [Chloroflexota bacterium]
MKDHFRISATGSSANYLPEYVARELGFMADEGIEVDSWVPNPWTGVLQDIDSSAAEAALGGIWVPAMLFNRVHNYRVFAQLNARFPMALLGREVLQPFDWHLLEEKVVLVPGSGGVAPFQFLAGLLREHGIRLPSITFVHDLSGDLLARMFDGGTGDFLLLDELTATSLARRGVGHVVAHLAETGGPMPNSVYYAPSTLLEREDRLAWRFTNALRRAMAWLADHPARDLEDLLHRRWPDVELDIAVEVVDGFRRSGVWTGVLVQPTAYMRWQNMLIAGGVIAAPVSYSALVDTRPAEAAQTSDGMPQLHTSAIS